MASLSLTDQSFEPTPEAQSGPWIENPAWTGLDLLLLATTLLLGTFVFSAIAVAVAHARGKALSEIAGNPSVWILIPAQGAAYAVVFVVLYLLATFRRLRFWESLRWNWPQGFLWMAFPAAGFTLAIVVGVLQKVLPMPKELPIEKLFLQPGAAQLLAVFGIAVAPFVEETLFRGLLYPVSNRWLRDVLNRKQSLRNAGWIFLLLIPWGFAVQWHRPLGTLLLSCTVLLLTGAAYAHFALEQSPAQAARVVLPGLTFFVWGVVASQLSRVHLRQTSAALLFVVLLFAFAALKLRPGTLATRLGIGLSFALTAVSFTALHAQQLASSWAPLLVLLLVSSVLTFTRARTSSLASSVLLHIGYNGTLFAGAFLATDHFRHLENISR